MPGPGFFTGLSVVAFAAAWALVWLALKDQKHRQIWLLGLIVVIHFAPHLAPDPPDFFYSARGIGGVALLWLLWVSGVINGWIFAATALFEGGTTVCAAIYDFVPAALKNGMCDAGSGWPLQILAGALAFFGIAKTLKKTS